MTKATIRLPQSEIEESSWPKIGEVSKRSGVGIEALRFYEKSGLINPQRFLPADAVFLFLGFLERASSALARIESVVESVVKRKAS